MLVLQIETETDSVNVAQTLNLIRIHNINIYCSFISVHMRVLKNNVTSQDVNNESSITLITVSSPIKVIRADPGCGESVIRTKRT